MQGATTYPLFDPASSADALQAIIPEHLCVGATADPFLYGGSGFAACIAAMERITDQPAIFATVQFVSKGRKGDLITFTPDHCSGGKSVKQCRLTARISDQPFAYLVGAAGQRPDPTLHQGSRPPILPLPDQCAERSVARQISSNLNALFEFRLAQGQLPDRRDWRGETGQDVAYWIRLRSGAALTRLDLPVIADCASLALPSALGRPASGNSLDNMIRFAGDTQEEWVLAHMHVASIQHGVAHINTHLYAQAGAVLAIASQSMLLREAPPV